MLPPYNSGDMSELDTILDAIGQLEDDEIELADAALQLARRGAPQADWQEVRAQLSTVARAAAAHGANFFAAAGYDPL